VRRSLKSLQNVNERQNDKDFFLREAMDTDDSESEDVKDSPKITLVCFNALAFILQEPFCKPAFILKIFDIGLYSIDCNDSLS
jgi:hypothetical protein